MMPKWVCSIVVFGAAIGLGRRRLLRVKGLTTAVQPDPILTKEERPEVVSFRPQGLDDNVRAIRLTDEASLATQTFCAIPVA